MRQRALGGDYEFMPYSAALGSIVVPKDSPVQSVHDLKGKRIGVAGGPLDKSWLLLRAYGKKQGAGDLAETASPVFGAPPLLNEQMLAGRIDALLNYWHYAARLEAQGYRRILPVADMMKAFGIESVLPLVGFVFPGKLAEDEPRLLRGFANAMQNAQKQLLTSDAEWDRIRPLMRVTTDAEFNVMRERYREGLLHTWSARDRQAAATLFHVLAGVGGEELVGQGVNFDPKAFWDGLVF
jgi:NitT/TauT family transport system substrate-binding protein